MHLEMTSGPGQDLQHRIVMRDIKEGAFRTLLIASGVMLMCWYLLANIDVRLGDMVQISAVLLTVGGATVLAYLLLSRSFTAARLIWLVGLAAANGVALVVFRRPELAYFFAVIPLLASAITFRWQWGLVALLGLVGLLGVAELMGNLLLPGLLSIEGLMVLLLGGIMWLIGAAYAQALFSVADWSMTNYRKARAELEQLRDERVGLLQVQEDFILANNELARLTERLAAMTLVAEEARRVKEDFVARVSHELRTPLNMIIGFSEVIMKSPQLYGDSIPSALLADVDSILRNSQHLSRLVDDILDLSQVEAGRMALTKDWSQLPEIIEEAVSAVKGLFDSKGLYLRTQVEPSLPVIFCDSTRIRQVIINLLGNAARFTEHGGVEITVGRKHMPGLGEQVQISVADSGPGIPELDQKRVFDPFQQAETVLRRHKGGTGLGLTISKQFVEMHGGRMWLESRLEAGTTFYFTLPILASQGQGEGENARRWFSPYFEYEPRTRQANLPLPKVMPRFVVVESEENLQRLITRYVENVTVVGVQHLEEGVNEVRRSPSHALIINGPEDIAEPAVQEHLGRLPFGTPVISCWLPGRDEAARRLGVVDYLVKPVNRQEVLGAVAQVVAQSPGARRVLLVDDEPEILRLFVRMLSSEGQNYSIIQAMNGRRALQLMRSRKPDVVLLDLVMPEMDGFEVLKEKSQDPSIRDIPVVVISSRSPQGETNISKMLCVTRGDGLTAHELLDCIEKITGILVPEEKIVDRAPAETPGETAAS